ncbi:hypothetical protein J4Q44_G00080890 [Coregonus suidteri]|uniref:Uncharacterized protein n=1 Tax=Coregonus suidteri TaxID=861788 RepID=A0AAN8M0C0_9TELE
MPANIPNGITQLFLDRNNIDDIPKSSPAPQPAPSVPCSTPSWSTCISTNSIESINGTQLCPFSLSSESLTDEALMPRLRYLRLDGNHLSPPVPLDIIMCFRHLKSIVI